MSLASSALPASDASSLVERLAGRVILLWGWRRHALALAAGGLLVLAQAPVDFAAAGFVSFPLLVWLLDGATERSPVSLWRRFWPFFAVGWWFGLGYFLAGLWWVGNAVFVEAESFLWALPFVVLGLPLLMAPFFGLATVLSRLFWDDGLGRILSLAFGFAVAEWLRGWAFTGFPWNPVGYGLMPTPLLMQSAHEIGTAGMNAAAVFLFAAPALVVGGRLWRTGLSLALLLGLLHVGYGAWRLSTPVVDARMLPVRIVQPSIDLSEKWDGAVRDRVLQTTLDLSQGPPPEGAEAPELIVWPETAVPFLLTERPDALAAIGAVGESGRLVLAGAVRAEAQQSGTQPLFYNSLVAVGADGTIVDAVDKVHLVPFGEYLPFQPLFDQFGITQIVAGPMNFAPGASRHAFTLPGGLKAVPFICYEIIFPELVERDAAGADLIVNVTNDGWFGDTAGPRQHFRHLQIRAVETGLPAVRAANNGISGAVDAHGRVIDALGMNARARLDLSLPVASPPSRLLPLAPSQAGLALAGLFGLAAFGLSALGGRRLN